MSHKQEFIDSVLDELEAFVEEVGLTRGRATMRQMTAEFACFLLGSLSEGDDEAHQKLRDTLAFVRSDLEALEV